VIPNADFILHRDSISKPQGHGVLVSRANARVPSFFDFTRPSEMLLGDKHRHHI